MHFIKIFPGFTWKELLLGTEEWDFLWETMLRTLIMFLVIMIGLRILGKRGIKQLSVFELVVIIGLGSAAGDPMFYKDVGILPALVVFALIIGLYKAITYFIGKSKSFEKLVEGPPICLIKDGKFETGNFRKEALGADEFFAELRQQGVSQLGQIEQAIEESSGSISVFFYSEEEVKYGLPIMPGSLDGAVVEITEPGYYACTFCGYTEKLKPVKKHTCAGCKKNEWVKATNKKRIR